MLKEALAAWKYWGVQRHLHWMPPESVAKAIARTLVDARRGVARRTSSR